MKKTLLTIVLIIAVIFAAGIFKDQIVRGIVTVAVTDIIGAPVHMDGFSLGFLRQSVRIAGLKVYNPKGFPRGILVDIPKISVDYDLGALLKKKINISLADFELKEMILTKNKYGAMNVDALKVSDDKGKAPSEAMPMQIDELRLSIGRIILKDYTGPKPIIEVHDINAKKISKNITSAHQLVMLVLMEGMKSAGIKGAQIYAVSAIAGVAMLPVAAGFTLAGNDSSQKDFFANEDQVYQAALGALNILGRVVKEDRQAGFIGAEVNSASVDLKISKAGGD